MMNEKPRLKILAGLGNPGLPYINHRHNVGYWVVDELIKRYSLTKKEKKNYVVYPWQHDHGTSFLVRSKSYMNDSGEAVSQVARFYKVDPNEVWLAYDDMDFDPGVMRVKKSGGAGGHNGIKSTISHFGKDFYRMRFGVGRPKSPEAVKSFVLSQPSSEEKLQIEHAISIAVDYIDLLLLGEYDEYVEKIHTETK